MINFIGGLLLMLLVAFLFGKIRSFIFKKAKPTLYNELNKALKRPTKVNVKLQKLFKSKDIFEVKKNLNASIGNVYHKNGGETFQWNKFKKVFDLGSGGEWAKSIKEIIDLRKLTIYLIILSCIFAYGYFKGRLNAPVRVNMSYEKEWIMNINGEEIYKPKYSNDVFIRDSKTKEVLKQIRAKDMGLLRKKLKPIGFILEPVLVAGYGAGLEGSGFEGGAGVSFIKYWKWKLDTFLTNKGIYLGTSYQVTDNTGVGIAAGKGWIGDSRIILYGRVKF